MSLAFFLIQAMNGVQYGLLLFLVASGLTIIFGIMGIVNLAHGSFYMIGAYLLYWIDARLHNLWIAIALALPLALALGYAVERVLIRVLYKRDHLYQVLLTYGLILIFNEAQKMLWGNDPHSVPVPAFLAGSIRLTENQAYPVYRLFMSGACIALAIGMYLVVQKTKLGMTVRAGAHNREMVQALGIDVQRFFAIVFSLGAALAALSGMIAAPASSIYPGMGEQILIISFVVVVIGGIGSVGGALLAAMVIAFADVFGKVLLPEYAGMFVYLVMAAVLLWRPEGLFRRA
jgi:branched-chain amino acid transport system permease protein